MKPLLNKTAPITFPDTAATKLLAALDLMEHGIELKLANLRRENPAATEAQIIEKLQAWLDHKGQR